MEMPFVAVLRAMLDEMQEAVDNRTINGRPIVVRHHRHRESTADERPCIALRFVGADPDEGRGATDGGLPEEVMAMQVDLVVDVDLLPEPTEEGELDTDPTGYGCASAMIRIVLDHLLPEGEEPNTLGGHAWDISYDGSSDNPGEMNPDFVRMEERLVIRYRVRADHPSELLMGN